MGRRGPKPKPQPILKLRNSWRAKNRTGGENLDQKRPACPQRFIRRGKTKEAEAIRVLAKRTWDRLCPLLHKAGLLVDSYREPFEALCDSYARFVYACQKCDAESMVEVTENGFWHANAWVVIRNKMWDQVYKGAACFGMTPADISSVRALEKPTEQESKKRFFSGGA